MTVIQNQSAERKGEFAPCSTCKQYSHSIGEDQLADAFNHFQSMYAHPLRGHPMGHWFDDKTRDAAQILIAAAREVGRRCGPMESVLCAVALAPRLSANAAGELLRELSFAEPYGCYSCFEMQDGFEEVAPSAETIPLAVRTALLGCYANDSNQIAEISHYRNTAAGLDVCWHWDGDGTLVFADGTFLLFNGDCKKDDEWEWHERGDWISEYLSGKYTYDPEPCDCGECLECDARARAADIASGAA